MKRIITITIFILNIVLLPTINAQNNKNSLSREQFMEKQKAFMTQKAELTEKEAKNFFPLYFELQEKKFKSNKEIWNKIHSCRNNPNISDEEYYKISEDIIKIKIEMDELELEYLKKYKKVLPAKKIYNIQRAEMRFHRELLKDTKNK